MAEPLTFRDLSVEDRRRVRDARLWCVILSAATFAAWSFGLFICTMAIVTPANPNPYGVGLYTIAPFILALPFGIMNAVLIFPVILSCNGFDFQRSSDFSIFAFLAVGAISIFWGFLNHEFQSLWYYTGPFCAIWSLLLPPTMLGLAVTFSRCQKTTLAE